MQEVTPKVVAMPVRMAPILAALLALTLCLTVRVAHGTIIPMYMQGITHTSILTGTENLLYSPYYRFYNTFMVMTPQ